MGSPDPLSNQPDHTLPGHQAPFRYAGTDDRSGHPTPSPDTKRLTLMSGCAHGTGADRLPSGALRLVLDVR